MKEIKNIAVIGLGYVGLPLALLAEQKGFDVIGIDLSKEKLDRLKAKKPIIDDDQANRLLEKTNIIFTDDFNKIQEADAAIICVPTPVDKNKNPDISLVENAAVTAAKNLREGRLLIIESTINPGVCDEIIIPAIEESTPYVIGKTLSLAHCPERINPGDDKWHVGNIPRVVGANSDAALDIVHRFYSKLVDADIKKMGSIKEAEACKVVENSFRDVNIAFVNELAMSFDKLGINVKNVIDGAATKPFAFMAHYPGIGVGGHCIPVDPYYLIEYARGKGFDHHFLTLARSINESMPDFAIDLLQKSLIEKTGKNLKGSSVAVLGISYKPNVVDDRESPAYTIINILKERGALVTTFDPHMPDKSSVETLAEAIGNKDAVILVTAHKEFMSMDIDSLDGLSVFIDGRNALNKVRGEFVKNNIEYIGIGT